MSYLSNIDEEIDEIHPPIFRNYHCVEFLEEVHKQEWTRQIVKEF